MNREPERNELHQPDEVSRVMAAMGRRGAAKRWAQATPEARAAQGAMLAKARKRAKRMKTKGLERGKK